MGGKKELDSGAKRCAKLCLQDMDKMTFKLFLGVFGCDSEDFLNVFKGALGIHILNDIGGIFCQ